MRGVWTGLWIRFGSALLVALAGMVWLTSTPVGAQDDDLDCVDFTFREDAQAELDADPDDPYNLDPNGDGIACALLPSDDGGATPEGSAGFQSDDEELDAEPTAADQTIEAAQDGNNGGGGGGGGGGGNRNRNRDDPTPTPTTDDGSNQNRNRNRNNNRNNRNNADVVCDDFATEEEAQVELDADDTLAASLDTNDDGFACSDGDDVDLPTEDELDDVDAGGVFVCEDYTTQGEAQAAFDVDPDLLVELDTNGDGIACSTGDDLNLERDPALVTVPTGRDLDCIDFDTQDEAQAVYDADRSDPNNLDPSNDGFACSELPSADGTVRVASIPNTGSGDGTGPGPGPGSPSVFALAPIGLAISAAGLAIAEARRRRGTAQPTRG